jgi:hypothetical protein
MPEWYEVCRYYQREVDFSRPAIVLGAVPEYQPFMEDWRGGYVAIAHPKCFAEREGDDELLDTVARNDLRQRGVRKASTSCAFSLWSGLLSTGAVWAVGSLSRADAPSHRAACPPVRAILTRGRRTIRSGASSSDVAVGTERHDRTCQAAIRILRATADLAGFLPARWVMSVESSCQGLVGRQH